ncbi:MAG: DUF2891 domain-containing protein [Deltaproteobacteria bacterium]|nr:DUF2891 domain-containing protein [Deltaproteobacteria bacterium]
MFLNRRTRPFLLPGAIIVTIIAFGPTIVGCEKPIDKQASVESTDALPKNDSPPPDYSKLLASLPKRTPFSLDKDRAVDFARLSLTCVDQEYPNKPSHVVDSDDSVKPPRKLHPAFFGCFDWHSAVHGHWAMLRLLKTFPKMSVADEIRKTLAHHLTEEKIAKELAYFDGKHHDLFERPYGWGWLLRLAAELRSFDDKDAAAWSTNLAPLCRHLEKLIHAYLETLSVPVRAGTHHSTAFALTHIHDFAAITNSQDLKDIVERRSRDFYGADVACPTAYEPSGEDFISPCLVEADLMRRVLPQGEFVVWLDKFLPPLDSPEFTPLAHPPKIKDRKDPKIGHLIGLSLQRAASYNGIAKSLPKNDPRREVFVALAEVHRDDGLKQMFVSGYGGAHWLASFAIYLLTDAGPYSAS